MRMNVAALMSSKERCNVYKQEGPYCYTLYGFEYDNNEASGPTTCNHTLEEQTALVDKADT